jgi:DNA-binding transcriptional LysR family regulator
MLDLDRSAVDVAVRFVPVAAGAGPALFEEEVQPLCAPRLLRDPRHPLRTPADLAHHTLLTVEMRDAPLTVDWEPWLQLMGLESVDMARTMRFTQYSEAVAAAVAGQGVVIGRLPLLADLLRRKDLVAPFASAAASRRGYFVQLAPRAAHNPDAQDFARWLLAEAQEVRASASPPAPRSPRPAAAKPRARAG